MKLTMFDILGVLMAAAAIFGSVVMAHLLLIWSEWVLGDHFNRVAVLVLFLLLWGLKLNISSLESRVSWLEKKK